MLLTFYFSLPPLYSYPSLWWIFAHVQRAVENKLHKQYCGYNDTLWNYSEKKKTIGQRWIRRVFRGTRTVIFTHELNFEGMLLPVYCVYKGLHRNVIFAMLFSKNNIQNYQKACQAYILRPEEQRLAAMRLSALNVPPSFSPPSQSWNHVIKMEKKNVLM